MVVTYSSYEEAQDNLGPNECVSGAWHEESGEAVYFNVRRDIDDMAMRMKAFEVRFGKPMTTYEKQVLETAMELR